uniref:IPPc domain-containing protein n=2 Tax=Ascaris TaxID=6251 RepID=A0A0M3I0D7_ASCLU
MNLDNWRIACITYNINARRTESDQIYQLLDQEDVAKSDIAVVALQELSHSEMLGAVRAEATWQASFCSWMSASGKSLLCKGSLASNLLLIFARLHVFSLVDKIDSRLSRSSFGGLTGHKGTLAIRVFLRDNRSLVFASSHLLPNPEGYESRCMQYFAGKSCIFNDKNINDENNSVIWLGDMNWRVDTLSTQQMFDRLNTIASDDEMDALVDEVDQLRRARREGKAFTDFSEAPIHFAPTYRIIVGRTRFDSERVPSWCDRILYRGSNLVCEHYRDNRTITISDHFPVIARFRYKASLMDDIQWNVVFEPIPRWLSVVPFTCRFSFKHDFWQRSGSYRDWIGVFPSAIPDPALPISWLYLITCYDTVIGSRTLTVAEFPNLSSGCYRLAYFSANRNCLQGISDPFEVENFG